ncbi:hypothetical protein ACFL5H_04320, partial [Candidatus Latescibacterota bacterium]
MKPLYRNTTLYILVMIVAASVFSCSSKGQITDISGLNFYTVPKILDNAPHDGNPTFIVYGDIRPSYWLKERFLLKSAWHTPKMLLVPFYQIYLFGSGLFGIVDYIRHNPGYGFSEREMVRDAIYAEHRQSNVDFVMNTGDYVLDGR